MNTLLKLKNISHDLPANGYNVYFQVAFPHSAKCFGRCYVGGATLITDAKGLFDGIGRLLAASTARELPKPVNSPEKKSVSENGNVPPVENGVVANGEQTDNTVPEENEGENNINLQTEETHGGDGDEVTRAEITRA